MIEELDKDPDESSRPAEKVKDSRTPTKTPMYTATNAARYHRQSIIRDIEAKVERKLLCYVAGKGAQIDRDDVAGFVDMLHNVTTGESVDLLLHTPGGNIDAAEKLITIVRSAVGDEGWLRVIVPDFAKSAGTLIAIGANSIVMSDVSELGPIDPQVWLKDEQGNEICHSVLGYLDAYKEHADALRKTPDDPVARMMLDKFNPIVLRKFEAIRDRARMLAENQLKRRGAAYSKIAGELMNTRRWQSHGQMIGWQDAAELGLQIDYLSGSDPIWHRYWELHCLQRLAVAESQRIFESNYASLVFDS